MSIGYNDEKRELIPRWRSLNVTTRLGELSSISNKMKNVETSNGIALARKYDEWEKCKTIPFASDLLNTAFIEHDLSIMKEVSTFILENDNNVPNMLKDFADLFLKESGNENEDLFLLEYMTNDSIKSYISGLKSKVRTHPRDAISWVELSRLSLIMGNEDKAKKHMKIALSLAPNNRYILRSATNLFLHVDDPLSAYKLLSKAEALKSDPWLLATEITVSTIIEKTSKNVKLAKALIERNNFSSKNVTELASALATIEYDAGSYKNSKKYFNLSLVDPNDNSFAQAIWAENRKKIINSISESTFKQIPFNFEAIAYKFRQEHEWSKVMDASENWLFDQPFSKDAATFASYIAATALGDYKKCIEITRKSLISNPNDLTLQNNLAFSLINLNKCEEASKILSNVNINDMEESMQVVWYATFGMYFYKTGELDKGRYFYYKSLELSDKIKDYSKKAWAAIYMAKEEVIINSESSNEMIERAIKYSKVCNEIEMEIVIERLLGLRKSDS